jgi:4-coumarate--CoA ligase
MLVHPSLISIAKSAAAKSGVNVQLYAFSDRKTGTVDGLQDWRSIWSSVEEGESWAWKKLNEEESQTQIAAINFSSG